MIGIRLKEGSKSAEDFAYANLDLSKGYRDSKGNENEGKYIGNVRAPVPVIGYNRKIGTLDVAFSYTVNGYS